MFGIKQIFLRSKSNIATFEFVWTLSSSVCVSFNNFLLINATDRSNISSKHHRVFYDVSLYPLSFFANTPFKVMKIWKLWCDMAAERQKNLFGIEGKVVDVLPHSYICKGKLETHVKAIHVMRIKTWKKILSVFRKLQGPLCPLRRSLSPYPV